MYIFIEKFLNKKSSNAICISTGPCRCSNQQIWKILFRILAWIHLWQSIPFVYDCIICIRNLPYISRFFES